MLFYQNKTEDCMKDVILYQVCTLKKSKTYFPLMSTQWPNYFGIIGVFILSCCNLIFLILFSIIRRNHES